MTVAVSTAAITQNSGSASLGIAYPDKVASNPGGVADYFLILCGWGNTEADDPAAPSGFTLLGTSYHGGAGTWGDNVGPRGISAYGRETDGAEAGTSTVTTKALTSNVATLTTSAAHGIASGNTIIVAGVGSPFDGTYTVTGVTSTTVSYARTNADISSQAATGTVAAGVVITNGGTGTDRTLRAQMWRLTKTGTAWVAPSVVGGTDTSLDTSWSIAPGSNPGSQSGDLAVAAGAWVPSENAASGSTAAAIAWTGAGLSTTTQRATGAATNGNNVRLNSYSADVSTVATGNVSFALTLAGTGGAGAGIIIRFRDSGAQLTANAGEDQANIEPWSTVTLDGTESLGNITSYTWSQTAGTTVTLSSTTVAAPTFTAPATAAGQTLTFQLQIGDGVTTKTDTVNVVVLPPTEFADSAGTLVPLRILAEG